MYLSEEQIEYLRKLLKTFFALPYSTDLDGKDAETLLRIVKKANGRSSRRKELFDIIDGEIGYSVKTLRKPFTAKRVDIQEQRFCDVREIRHMMESGGGNAIEQGHILLAYMKKRIQSHMEPNGVKVAKSLILLKDWNANKTKYRFKYWEEDFLEYIDNLLKKDEGGEIEWLIQEAGLHGRDKMRQDSNGKNVRLIRMHYKHNQIFTDHDIPEDVIKIEFNSKSVPWNRLVELLELDFELGTNIDDTNLKTLPLFP